jgi:hypothetical protein
MENQLRICEAHSVPIQLASGRSLIYKGLECAGYFDDAPLGFGVACGGSPRGWFSIFVHETCHMQQWLDQSPIWTRQVDGRNPSDVFDSWISGREDLPAATLGAVIDALVDVEIDCEQRVAGRIRELGLPIKLETHVRKSNAYAWSYRYMQETRDWDHSALYQYPQVWRRMPAHFDNDYSVLPARVRAAFDAMVERLEMA